MVRKFVCALVALVLAAGVGLAEEYKGKFKSADEKSITIVTGKKGEEKDVKLNFAKEVKIAISDSVNSVKTLTSAKPADVKGQLTITTKKTGDTEEVIEIKGPKPKP